MLTSLFCSLVELEIEWLIIHSQLPFILRHGYNLLTFFGWVADFLVGDPFID
jgi:hypothetical protein